MFTKEEIRESMLVYAVTDRYWLKEGETLLSKCEEVLAGGATFLQLREKKEDRGFIKEEALALQKICSEKHIPFVLDDDAYLAAELDLDGVHVGQSDLEAGKVREIIGPDKILGVSAETVEEAIRAEQAGADYLGVGAVFPTGSKDDAIPVTHDVLREICDAVSIPVVAIGGITLDNMKELAGTGIDGIAVISAIFGQPDLKYATERLRREAKRRF